MWLHFCGYIYLNQLGKDVQTLLRAKKCFKFVTEKNNENEYGDESEDEFHYLLSQPRISTLFFS